jgi:hypothetical protein
MHNTSQEAPDAMTNGAGWRASWCRWVMRLFEGVTVLRVNWRAKLI